MYVVKTSWRSGKTRSVLGYSGFVRQVDLMLFNLKTRNKSSYQKLVNVIKMIMRGRAKQVQSMEVSYGTKGK